MSRDEQARELLAQQYDLDAAEHERNGHLAAARTQMDKAAAIRAGKAELHAIRAIIAALSQQSSMATDQHSQKAVRENLATIEAHVRFVRETAEYWSRSAARAAEDVDHWAAVANAINCRSAADYLEALRGASGGGVARGTVKDADVDALRYLLNWGDSKSRIRTIMRTVTDDGEATQDRLERLWNALVRPAPDHPAENAKPSGEVRCCWGFTSQREG